MDFFTNIALFIQQYAQYTQYIAFGLLILAGFNIPVSEDIVYLVSASIAATLYPDHAIQIFFGCFMGAFFSDIWSYLVGKYMLNWFIRHPRLSKYIPVHRIETMERYFQKYGKKTLFFGRFIPFGFRNAVFMTCGVLRMKFLHFVIIDFLALCCTSAILFSLGYRFGSNWVVVFNFISKYNFILFILVFAAIAFMVWRFIKHHHSVKVGISEE